MSGVLAKLVVEASICNLLLYQAHCSVGQIRYLSADVKSGLYDERKVPIFRVKRAKWKIANVRCPVDRQQLGFNWEMKESTGMMWCWMERALCTGKATITELGIWAQGG
jgi:hypothetical protein